MEALPILASKGVKKSVFFYMSPTERLNKHAGLYVSRLTDENCNRSTEIHKYRCLPESFAAIGTSEEINLTLVVGENMVPEHSANSHV